MEQEKIRAPRHLAHLSIWMSGLGYLDIETKLKSLDLKWI